MLFLMILKETATDELISNLHIPIKSEDEASTSATMVMCNLFYSFLPFITSLI